MLKLYYQFPILHPRRIRNRIFRIKQIVSFLGLSLLVLLVKLYDILKKRSVIETITADFETRQKNLFLPKDIIRIQKVGYL